MKIQNHATRTDLIEIIRRGDGRAAEHLAKCRQCRIALDIMRWSGCGRGQVEWEPSSELVQQLKAVPLLARTRRPRKAVRAVPVMDSWSDRPAVAVRQAPFGVERRVRFEVGEYTLEFVASRNLDGWDCVARVYKEGRPARRFILKAGSRNISAGPGGCFIWSSAKPPRRLAALSPELQIDLERLEW